MINLKYGLFLQQAEFFEYMKEHDEDLLKFDAAEIEVSTSRLILLYLDVNCAQSFDLWLG